MLPHIVHMCLLSHVFLLVLMRCCSTLRHHTVQSRLIDEECVVSTTPDIAAPEFASELLKAAKAADAAPAGQPPPTLPKATPGMDLWSLGCVLFHLIVGSPFLAKAAKKQYEAAEAAHTAGDMPGAQTLLLQAAAGLRTQEPAVRDCVELWLRGGNPSMMRLQAANLLESQLLLVRHPLCFVKVWWWGPAYIMFL